MNSIVLIGDIKSSQALDPQKRKEIQELLQQALEDINTEEGGLVSPPTITLGDEFQAVYNSADSLLQHTWKIMSELHPVNLRFSIGIGSISTSINREQAIGMDGPAFYVARSGIDLLKESGFIYHISIADTSGNNSLLNLINGSLHLVSREMSSWKKTRFTILYLLDQGVSFKEIAEHLDISESAVYKNRDGGSLDVILNLKNSITELINRQLKL